MRLPIRVRLTAWYVVLLAAIIVGAGRVPRPAAAHATCRPTVDRDLRAARPRSRWATATEGTAEFRDVSAHRAARRRAGAAGARRRRPRAADLRRAAVDGRRSPARAIARPRAGRPDACGDRRRAARRRHFRTSGAPGAPARRAPASWSSASRWRRVDALGAPAADPAAASPGPAALAATAARRLVAGAPARCARRSPHDRRRPADRHRPACTSASRSRPPATRSRHLAVDAQRDARPHRARASRSSTGSSPTPPTSCAPRWPPCAPSSTSASAPTTSTRRRADVLRSTREEVDRLSRTVDGLLTLARADEGRARAADAPARPRRRGRRCRRAAARAAPARATSGSRPRLEPAPARGDARGWDRRSPTCRQRDQVQPRRAATVTVATADEADEAAYGASTTGPGIPARRARARLRPLPPRRRVAHARDRRQRPRPVDLREIARAHGGRAWTEPGPRRGSLFVLAVPTAGDRAGKPEWTPPTPGAIILGNGGKEPHGSFEHCSCPRGRAQDGGHAGADGRDPRAGGARPGPLSPPRPQSAPPGPGTRPRWPIRT